MINENENLSDIQTMLRDSLAKVLDRQYDFETRQAIRSQSPGYSQEAWIAYAELGLFALGIDEDKGGAGGDLNDLALICQQLGGALTLEPFIPTVVFGGRLLSRLGNDAQQSRWLSSIISGEVKVALAHTERESRYGNSIQTHAVFDGEGYVLNGQKSVVEGGDCADLLVVSANLQQPDGGSKLCLFLLPTRTEGLERKSYRTFDGQGGADFAINNARVPAEALLGDPETAASDLDVAIDEATLLQCADAVGAMKAANKLTQDYARVRKQFGTAIGNFQTLQHRMVDMAVAAEMAGALTEAVITGFDADPDQRPRSVSAAKVRVGESARLVGQQAIQLHGGMGLTDEYPASHYFARLGLFERRWGDADHHIKRFAERLICV